MISPGFASIPEASAAPVIVGLRIEPLSAEIAVDAAIIRGSRRIVLADAIHLATARAAGATAFVTNDRRLRGSVKLEVVYLDDLEVEPQVA
jgi:predicted nucleic acid-binding protein